MLRLNFSLLLTCLGAALACGRPPVESTASGIPSAQADPAIVAFVDAIRAVDNHTHVNSVAPNDTDFDALPLDGILPIELPATLLPENPSWLGAYRGLYKYPHADLSDSHRNELRATMQQIVKTQGDNFPTWVLDQLGTEVMLANRISMGPGLPAPRFRWVSYVDALMLPLSTAAEAATSPDRQKLYPLEDALLRRYLADLAIATLPATLDDYVTAVVTRTLETQRKNGCVAVKFEAAYLRSLDFGDADAAAAGAVYARYAGGGTPSHADYKTLQDYLFRYIAREAGRLGMAVHIHSLEGAGNFFDISGADPLLLESALNDPALRQTNFVIIHGGGVFAAHAGALLWKPNVYVDTSLIALAYPPARLTQIFRDWLTQFPQKVLYGSDASAFGPEMGWEVAAWVAGKNARNAIASALTEMVRGNEITRARADEIATMVLRGNATKLYQLGLK